MIKLQQFAQDPYVVAETIYQGKDRMTTNMGLLLSSGVRKELDTFIQKYIDSSYFPQDKEPFLRIDAYINPDGGCLQILDINASFVDGWGNALNMTRSVNMKVNQTLLETFPAKIMLQEEHYRPEFELAIKELKGLGIVTKETTAIDGRQPTYIYGNPPLGKSNENAYPYDALRMDNKRLLARFSEKWSGTTIKVPKIYTPECNSWDSIPDNGVLKLVSKQDIAENPDIRRVQFGVKKNSTQLRKLWDAGRVIVQEPVETIQELTVKSNAQAIILTTRKAIVGYTQFSSKRIINDDSIQGPLILQN